MWFQYAVAAWVCLSICGGVHASGDAANVEAQPTVLVSLLVQNNRAGVLPYSLRLLEEQDYPKNRMAVHVQRFGSDDESDKMLETWGANVSSTYHRLTISKEEAQSIMAVHEDALEEARRIWADKVLFLDADVLLTDASALRFMVEEQKGSGHQIAGLLLRSPRSQTDDHTFNFWLEMTADFHEEGRETAEWKRITTVKEGREKGCFSVSVVRSCVLVDLRSLASQALSFLPAKIQSYRGPEDPSLALMASAKAADITTGICNGVSGFSLAPKSDEKGPSVVAESLVDLKLLVTVMVGPLLAHPLLQHPGLEPTKNKDRLGVDEVYVINLERRPDRREKVEHCLSELGAGYTWIKAVDGKLLDANYLESWGIKELPGFDEPSRGGPLKWGEIGCFMSHYHAWTDMVEQGHEAAIVLEDDANFLPRFRQNLGRVLGELREFAPDWELCYLGRKVRTKKAEAKVQGSSMLKRAGCSYWTVGYLLSQKGAQKLIEAGPLAKMIPVDEYLPVMYNAHPNSTWASHFPNRDLVALAADPVIIAPSFYTGSEGYVTDTEDSAVVSQGSSAACDAMDERVHQLKKRGKPAAAVELLKELIAQCPSAERYDSLAAFLRDEDKNEEAVEIFKKALAIAPDHMWTLYQLGMLLCWLEKDVIYAGELLERAIPLLSAAGQEGFARRAEKRIDSCSYEKRMEKARAELLATHEKERKPFEGGGGDGGQCKWQEWGDRLLKEGGDISLVGTKYGTVRKVEERDADTLSYEEFMREYAMKRKPLVIKGLAKYLSESRNVWSLEYIERTCGEKVITPRVFSPTSKNWAGLEDGNTTRVAAFLEKYKAGTTKDYLFDWPLPKGCPEITRDFVVPKYFAGDLLQQDPTPQKDPTSHVGVPARKFADAWPSLFVGPKHSGGGLHIDTFGSNFWMAMLDGYKLWQFFDVEDIPYLYMSGDERFKLNVRDPDYEQFPLFAYANMTATVIGAGDGLFVPGGSPHQVTNLGPTVAVSMNYVDQSNIDVALRVTRKQNWELSNLFKPLKGVGLAKEGKDLPWAEFKNQLTRCDELDHRAQALWERGEPAAAAEVLTEEIAKCPPSAERYNSLAGMFRDQMKYEEAVEIFKKALAIAPDHMWTLFQLGMLLCWLEKDVIYAGELLERAIPLLSAAGQEASARRAASKLETC